MTRMIAAAAVAAGIVAGLAGAPGALGAQELRVSPGAPPAHPAFPMYEAFSAALPGETGGLTAVPVGVEVVNVGNMKDSLQSQITEVGNFLPLYYAADVPNTALMGDLAFLATSAHAMGAAMTEYVVTCADCQAEFRAAGLVFGGSGSSDPYKVLTNVPVESLEDLQGLRLRSGGSPFSRWAESVGAVPASIPVSDQFESLSQGAIDGTIASINDLVAYRMVDLVTDVLDVSLGTYHCTVNFAVAAPAWERLTPEQRAGLIRAANGASALFTQDWAYERPAQARAEAEAAGLTFHQPSPELAEAIEAFRATEAEAAVRVGEETYGIADAADKVARFQELVAKWTAIVEETGDDPAAIAARVQAEVWDKVDYATYGL